MSSYPHFEGTDGTRLPVGTMFCVGKNYAAHAREMGGDVPPDPLIFLKPPAAFVPSGGNVVHPPFSDNVHHEVELVLIIGQDCANVPKSDALSVLAGYAIGLDMTLRDVQTKAKDRGEPWAVAKGFVTSAPVSKFVPTSRLSALPPVFDLQLHVNDQLRQFGSTAQMERSIETLVEYLSTVFTLRRGDCIFTGTPEGVGRVRRGDILRAELNGDFSEIITLQTEIL